MTDHADRIGLLEWQSKSISEQAAYLEAAIAVLINRSGDPTGVFRDIRNIIRPDHPLARGDRQLRLKSDEHRLEG